MVYLSIYSLAPKHNKWKVKVPKIFFSFPSSFSHWKVYRREEKRNIEQFGEMPPENGQGMKNDRRERAVRVESEGNR